jgi:hypothetical protein
MVRTKLPAFLRYKKSIINFAKVFRIRILIKENVEGEGEYLEGVNWINVDDDLTDQETIATMLHELGHAMDFLFNPSMTGSQSEKAYEKFYTEKHSKSQRQLVLGAENRAWDNGKVIAQRLKIPLGTWYLREKQISMKNYRSVSKKGKKR